LGCDGLVYEGERGQESPEKRSELDSSAWQKYASLEWFDSRNVGVAQSVRRS
jgi:hypothetical protein